MNNSEKQSKENTLRINEIFYSIQGESTYAGLPCVFIRMTYCNLRCSYCDTEYAFFEGEFRTFDEIIDEVKKYKCKLIEITGGEPLVQNNVLHLMRILCDEGYDVLIETGGHIDISIIDPRVKRIMDIKCPGSGESEKVRWENIDFLKPTDQVKFVVGNRDDYDWAKDIFKKYELTQRCTVLMSPVFGKIENIELASWILSDQLNVRFQIQMHKYIWDPAKRGV